MMSDASPVRRILFVCTANICRSPTAEVLSRHEFGEGRAHFRSAGFLDSGQRPPELLARALAEVGVDVTGHRSYQLNAASLEIADLVLTMEGDHVQQATLLHRPSFPKIIPLKEAAEIASRLGPSAASIESLVAAVNEQRDPSSYLSTQWDVDDPYKRKLKDYRRAVSEIHDLVTTLIGRLV